MVNRQLWLSLEKKIDQISLCANLNIELDQPALAFGANPVLAFHLRATPPGRAKLEEPTRSCGRCRGGLQRIRVFLNE